MTGTVARCRFDDQKDCNDGHGGYCSKKGSDDNEKYCIVVVVVGAALCVVVNCCYWSEGKFGT